ncbi:MAG: 16S rRNA (cytosine(1402)-N(4))-methyltransferase RsmH [Nevskiaceae bacterium]|nr:MAG: 16S rRNA (cytosine(1402)-N(4))-methyltransferase RsmH [Nevskiaceae bacterium]
MFVHRPVMLAEALAGLGVTAGGIYVDGTFGRGGHSGAILDALHGSGELHAMDQDPQACGEAFRLFGERANFRIHHRNFSQLAAMATEQGIAGRVNGILLDLGVSSPQLDDAARGFSFGKDGPLDMRMNPQAGESAAQWLAQASEREIADVLWTYGEERNSRRIARRIVETRVEAPLATTAQLAALIASVPGPRSHHIHPATRSFQAIRIHINRELDVLESVLQQALDVLAPGGRLVVISFHSLEDRIVKRFMRDASREAEIVDRRLPMAPKAGLPPLRLIGRKQLPGDAECAENPRARSAVLRVAERQA